MPAPGDEMDTVERFAANVRVNDLRPHMAAV